MVSLTTFPFFFLFACHFGLISSKVISMPLKDNMQASLKADLDVDEMNKYLTSYIQQEVKKGVKDALTSLVEDMVKKQTEVAEMVLAKRLEERQQYAFFATSSTNRVNLAIDTVLIFDVVSLNVGSAYSGVTGKFTCQVDGLYNFSWTILSTAEKDFTSSLVVNGNRIAGNVVDNDQTSDALSSSSTVIVNLQKGDLVWLEVKETAKNHVFARWSGQYSSMFSGFKIN